MIESQTSAQRRSSRVFTRIPVRATGKNTDGRKFRENSQTIVINAHGGLLYLQAPIALGAQLVLINPVTEEEQECRVVDVGSLQDGKWTVGIEFVEPVTNFWKINFPPYTPRRLSARC